MQERRRTPETGCYQGPQPESQAQPYAKGGKCTGSPGRVQLLDKDGGVSYCWPEIRITLSRRWLMASKGLRWPRRFPETMSWDEARGLQWRMLVPQLEHAYCNSLFYQRRFDAVGVRPKDILSLDDYFEKVPFNSKEQFIEDQAKAPPFGD